MSQRLALHIGRVDAIPYVSYVHKGGHLLMKTPLDGEMYYHPTAELFEVGLKDIGIYFSDLPDWTAPPETDLVQRSAEFIQEAASALEGFSLSRAVAPLLYHNKKVTVTTKVHKRSRTQALKSLRRSNWTCQVCSAVSKPKLFMARMEKHVLTRTTSSRGERKDEERQRS